MPLRTYYNSRMSSLPDCGPSLDLSSVAFSKEERRKEKRKTKKKTFIVIIIPSRLGAAPARISAINPLARLHGRHEDEWRLSVSLQSNALNQLTRITTGWRTRNHRLADCWRWNELLSVIKGEHAKEKIHFAFLQKLLRCWSSRWCCLLPLLSSWIH